MSNIQDFEKWKKEKESQKNLTKDNFYIRLYNSLIRNRDLKPYEKLILIYLQGYGQDAFPSYKTIAEDLNISRNTVIRNLKSLQENDYIYIKKRFKEKERLTSMYQLSPIDKNTGKPEKNWSKVRKLLDDNDLLD